MKPYTLTPEQEVHLKVLMARFSSDELVTAVLPRIILSLGDSCEGFVAVLPKDYPSRTLCGGTLAMYVHEGPPEEPPGASWAEIQEYARARHAWAVRYKHADLMPWSFWSVRPEEAAEAALDGEAMLFPRYTYFTRDPRVIGCVADEQLVVLDRLDGRLVEVMLDAAGNRVCASSPSAIRTWGDPRAMSRQKVFETFCEPGTPETYYKHGEMLRRYDMCAQDMYRTPGEDREMQDLRAELEALGVCYLREPIVRPPPGKTTHRNWEE